jgi:hypothetical protein
VVWFALVVGYTVREQWTGNESIREERARLESIRTGKAVSPSEYWREQR